MKHVAHDSPGGFLLTGSFTDDGGGSGAGIGALRADGEGGVHWLGTVVGAEAAPSPSFLAGHPTLPVVYAVAESAGQVRAFRQPDGGGADGGGADGGRADGGGANGRPDAGADDAGIRNRSATGGGPIALEPYGDAWPAGASACHVAVDPAGRYIVVACWGDGQVILYELDDAGAIVNRLVAPAATDPHGDSAHDDSTHDNSADNDSAGDNSADDSDVRPSRAHTTLVLPEGGILTTDLGFDLLRVWRYEAGTGLVPDHDVVLPAGSGPRHVALNPSGHVYIVTEMSIEVFVVGRGDDGRFAIVSSSPATAGGAQAQDAAAEISIDAAAEHVYVGVRGSDRISTLAVRDAGARLEPVADVSCGGTWPRHHLLRGPWLHVANERSNTVATLRIDPDSGVPAELVGTTEVGSPSCLMPVW